MERKYPEQSRSFGPVKLYIDDLETLIDLLTEPGEDLTIESETVRCTSLDELKQHEEQRLSEISISSGILRGYVHIKKRHVFLRMSHLDSARMGIYLQLERFLRSKQRRPRQSDWVYVVAVSLNFPLFILSQGLSQPYKNYVYLVIGLLTFLFFANLLVGRLVQSQIYLVRRSEHPDFWSTNMDKIIIEVIKVVLAATLGAGLTLLVQEILKRTP